MEQEVQPGATEESPLVSVIVRTKDRPKLLRKALASIAAQTYRPIEVVLVNDGGCDLDVEELKDILGDVSLNYQRLERNTGRAHAGNVGIKNAKGKYIGFLDDDDEFYPEHVETLVGFLKQSDYKVAYTDAEVLLLSPIDETGDFKETQRYPRESVDFSLENLLLQNYISFMSLMFCMEVLTKSKGFDEEFDLCEDWDLIIRIGLMYPFYHIKGITAKYNFWSKENQVTVGHEKLAPYRHRVLVKHFDKMTPEVLYTLFHEGKWMGTLTFLEKISSLNDNMRHLERDRGILQSDNRTLLEDNKVLQTDNEILRRDVNILKSDNEVLQKEVHRLGAYNETLQLKNHNLENELLRNDVKIKQLNAITASNFYKLWCLFYKRKLIS